ncbi:MAG TPA: class I SAM-dependent methyltransferase [Pseudogracilibacillus sp.]|nr:class I SAM-dependent methyltransferase [Pseudogracilibacillus sp.]
MTTYGQFALLYDELMKEAPYDAWYHVTVQATEGKKVHSVLDLGCGTGEITLRLATQFPRIYGVDLSNDMLTIARKKAELKRANITWVQQDIRFLEGFKNIDLVVSYCDVINYIVEQDELKKVFQHVYDSLTPGGTFIFDIHSMDYVKNKLWNNTFAYSGETLAYIWDCFPGNEAGEMFHEMTFFYQNEAKNDTYLRFDETHHQRTFPIETYIHLLKEIGFQKIKTFADFSYEIEISQDKGERIFFVLEK